MCVVVMSTRCLDDVLGFGRGPVAWPDLVLVAEFVAEAVI